MPKLKSHRGMSKRMRLLKSGKVKRTKANAGHLMSGKSSKRKRAIRKSALVSPGELALARRMLGA